MEELSPFNCCLSFVFYVALGGWRAGGGFFSGGGGGGGGGELNTENTHAEFCHIK